jgi:hypothetical protein
MTREEAVKIFLVKPVHGEQSETFQIWYQRLLVNKIQIGIRYYSLFSRGAVMLQYSRRSIRFTGTTAGQGLLFPPGNPRCLAKFFSRLPTTDHSVDTASVR